MNDTFTPESINPTTPETPATPGISPVNAFVAALAEQVFQRVTKNLDDAVKILINEALARLDPREQSMESDISLSMQAYVREQITLAFDNFDVEDAVSDAIDNIDLLEKIDTSDIVRSVLDDGDFEDKVNDIVRGMTFDVSVS